MEAKQDDSWRELSKVEEDGETVWLAPIVDKLTPEQKEAYDRVVKRLAEEHNITCFGEMEVVRNLHGMDYQEDETLNFLLDHYHYLNEHEYWSIDDVEDIQHVIDMNIITPHKFDKYGKPVVYTVVSRYFPAQITDE